MRHRLWTAGLCGLALFGCTVEELTGAAPPVPAASAASASLPVAQASEAPIGEAIAPLDLSAETWVPDQPAVYEIAGDTIKVLGRVGARLLVYRPPLGDDYRLRFHEDRQSVNGSLELRWSLDPGDAPKKDAAGNPRSFATFRLALAANGDVAVSGGGMTPVRRAAVPGPRDWELQVRGAHSTVRLNGEVLADFDHPAGYHPAPYLAFNASIARARTMAITGVAVETGSPSVHTAVVRQWSLEGREAGVNRFTLIHAADAPGLPPPARLDTLPAQLPHVAAVGGSPLGRLEALVYARTDGLSGGTHGGAGIYLTPRGLQAGALAAHEMSHGYGQGGGRGARSPEGWLIEGMADYLGHAAYQHYLGKPTWRTPAIGRVPAVDLPLSLSNAEAAARGGASSNGWRLYTKGRIFLSVLAAATSEADVRAVIVANRSLTKITGEGFVSALEARTGKDLSALRPGWLVDGAYRGVSPADANDNDHDGLLDFQAAAFGHLAGPQLGEAEAADAPPEESDSPEEAP